MAIMTSNKRGTGSGKYSLQLDNMHAGWISEFEGGLATADVINEKIGGDCYQKKHIGNVKYEDASFKVGTGMSKSLYEWIKTGFDQTFNASGKGRQNGAIVTTDYDYKEVNRIEFTFAIMTELNMPALDAGSKDAAKMGIKFKPEISRRKKGSGTSVAFAAPISAAKQKMWTPANFRLHIDGLDVPCQRVNKIEALTIKQSVAENAVGEMRDYEQEPTKVEVPNLVITLSEAYAEDLYAYHEDFVIKGNCKEGSEKTGSLVYLANDLTTELFTLTFHNLGIFKLTADKVEAGTDGVRRIKAEFYCEKIDFNYAGAATFG